MGKLNKDVPAGVYVVGVAVGDFEFQSGVTSKGKPWQMVRGKVLAGDTFVNVTESVQTGQVPHIPRAGEQVRAVIVPNFKTNGVVVADVRLERPDVVSVVGTK